MLADGVIPGAGLFTPKAIEYAKSRIERGAKSAGRDPRQIEIIGWSYTSVSEKGDEATQAVAGMVYYTIRMATMDVWMPTGMDMAYVEQVKKGPPIDPGKEAASIPQGVINQFGAVGTPAECRKRIGEIKEAGINHIGFLIMPGKSGLKSTVRVLVEKVLKEFLK